MAALPNDLSKCFLRGIGAGSVARSWPLNPLGEEEEAREALDFFKMDFFFVSQPGLNPDALRKLRVGYAGYVTAPNYLTARFGDRVTVH